MTRLFDLTGKVALVTGGSRGIGRSIALALRSHGAQVAINYATNEMAAEETVGAMGGIEYAIMIQGDVADPAVGPRLVEETVRAFGKIDILVNNAGVTRDDLILRMSEEEWDTVIDTNLKGTFTVTKAAIRPMVRQRHGRIISVASVAGLVGNAGQSNYAAAKAGIVGFSKSAAQEFARFNISVNALCPGFIETDMVLNLTDEVKQALLAKIPAGRFGKPEEVAAITRFLCTEGGYITGAQININGGMYMQ